MDNNRTYTIRQEREADYYNVEALVKRAFWNQNVPGCNEHYLAHCMREHEDFIKELSLVLEDPNLGIVACVMYAKSKLIDENGHEKVILTFGPLAVDPSCQRKGYGKALLEYSFDIAVKLGYDTIVIFGNPDNYVGRGFKSCIKYDVCIEKDTYPSAMMVKELTEGVLAGHTWQYIESNAYQIDMDKFDTFDKTHEQMVPAYKPCQEEFYIHCRSLMHR